MAPSRRARWRAASGKVERWLENTDKANGLFFAADGTLYACQMGAGRRLAAIDPATKQVTTVAERIDGKRFNAPNDLAVDAGGGIWFTDPAHGGEIGAPAEAESAASSPVMTPRPRLTESRSRDAPTRSVGNQAAW